MRRRWGAILVVLVLLLSPASSALAGPPGQWTEFTTRSVNNFSNHGYARTSDGVVHVAWWNDADDGGFRAGLVHSSFAPDGTPQASNQMVAGGVWDPGLVLNANGTLRAFFGMLGDGHGGLTTATAPTSGAPWTLNSSDIAEGGAAYVNPIGALRTMDGTFFQAWGDFVHRGLSAGTPNHDYRSAFGCCAYQAELAQDQQSGEIYRVWYSNASSRQGLLAQEVDAASGAPSGTVTDMPRVAEGGDTAPMTGNPAVASIPGQAGVYVAYHGGYPVSHRVLLWRIGDADATVLHQGDDDDNEVAMAVAPDGRIWVLWAERSTTEDNRIFYRVSDTSRSSWSPVASFQRPPDGAESHTLYSLAAEAQSDRLDAFAHIGFESGGVSTWHTQIMAPVQGSDGDDSIEGTPENDVIFAGNGDDTIDGGGGNDIIVGGGGNDTITGGGGKDSIEGGAGNDKILGDVEGSGKGDVEAAQAGGGADKIIAGAGNDQVHAGGAKDKVVGGGGTDTMWGDSGNDKLQGQAGNDTLYGGEGVNDFDGGAGRDHCILSNKKDDTQSCEKKTRNFTRNFTPAKLPS
jgi:hypothetical protein